MRGVAGSLIAVARMRARLVASRPMRRRLDRARASVPALVRELHGAGRAPVVLEVLAHPEAGPLVVLARTGGKPDIIVKVADGASAVARIQHEAAVLARLHGMAALGTWRALVPRLEVVQDEGDLVVTAVERLAGAPPSRARDDAGRATVLQLGLAAIAPLHQATGVERETDEALLDAWVRAPIRRIEEARGPHADADPDGPRGTDRARASLDALERRMLSALRGRRLTAATVHGDFWMDNLLLADGVVSGIVDWEAAREGRSPAIDTLGLLLAVLRVGSGLHTGEVAASLLGPGGRGRGSWAGALPAADEAAHAAGLDRTTAILLAWLDALAGTLHRRPGLARDSTWLRRNVDPVVAALAGLPAIPTLLAQDAAA